MVCIFDSLVTVQGCHKHEPQSIAQILSILYESGRWMSPDSWVSECYSRDFRDTNTGLGQPVMILSSCFGARPNCCQLSTKCSWSWAGFGFYWHPACRCSAIAGPSATRGHDLQCHPPSPEVPDPEVIWHHLQLLPHYGALGRGCVPLWAAGDIVTSLLLASGQYITAWLVAAIFWALAQEAAAVEECRGSLSSWTVLINQWVGQNREIRTCGGQEWVEGEYRRQRLHQYPILHFILTHHFPSTQTCAS